VVEISDDTWEGRSASPADAPWSGDDERAQEFSDQRGETLKEHLLWQLELAHLDARARAIGRAIIDAINDDGYLVDPLDEVATVLKPELETSVSEIEAVLAHVQAFDPVGIAARSVAECIELQLQQLDPSTPALATARTLAAPASGSGRHSPAGAAAATVAGRRR
jgi:RNA polymerase sigma-54 factor